MTITNPKYLYIHVPFCKSICGYCDFAHTVYQERNVDIWLEAISKEIKDKHINPHLKTIYVGGGTPTCLSSDQLDTFLSLLDPYSNKVKEYTIEINPETLDKEKALILKKHGINRASIGLQTSDSTLLKLLGRHHTYEDVSKCISLLKEVGIHNISLDIMYSLPHQTIDTLNQTIEDAIKLKPTHLSLYSLTIEENTIFSKKGYQHLDDEIEADMYEFILKKLKSNNYKQYEVSNYCLEGYESIHNSAYWNYEDFYGIGCGSSGKENHIRYDHTKSLQQYIQNPFQTIITELSKEDEMFEMVMMGIRLVKGMDIDLFEERFHTSFLDVYVDKIQPLLDKQLVEISDGYFRCTSKGYEIMNTILVELM